MKLRSHPVVWIVIGFLSFSMGIMSLRGLIVANKVFSMRGEYQYGELVVDFIDMNNTVRGRSSGQYGVGVGKVDGVSYKYTIEWEPSNRKFWEGYDWRGYLSRKIEVAVLPKMADKILCAKSIGAIPRRFHENIGWEYSKAILCVVLELIVGVWLMRRGGNKAQSNK